MYVYFLTLARCLKLLQQWSKKQNSFFLKVDSSENLFKTSKVLPGKILSKQKTSQIFMNFLEMCQVGAKSERKRFSFMPPVQNKLIFEKYNCEKFNRAFRTEETNFLFSLV